MASKVPNTTMGSFSVFMTLLLGIKFIVKPVMTTKETMNAVSGRKRIIQSVFSGVIVGFIWRRGRYDDASDLNQCFGL